MRYLLLCALLTGSLVACGDVEPVSVQVYPAVLAGDAPPEAADWDSVRIAPAGTAQATTYRVAPRPLVTEWNFIAVKAAARADGVLGIAARLNAFAIRELERHAAGGAGVGRPLAVRIEGRWADVMPGPGPARDRMTIFGFTRDEVERLEHHVQAR